MINQISESVINYETTKVTAISVAVSMPSSAAPAVAIGAATADISSYFAHILRVVQELAYLYGFEDWVEKANEMQKLALKAVTKAGVVTFDYSF